VTNITDRNFGDPIIYACIRFSQAGGRMLSQGILLVILGVVLFFVIQFFRRLRTAKFQDARGYSLKARMQSLSPPPKAASTPYSLIHEKEYQIGRIRRELDALRIAAPLLEGDD
jgi:hypothetical protein